MVAVIVHPSFRSDGERGTLAVLSESIPLLARCRRFLGRCVEDDRPFDDGRGDVCHGAIALVVGKHFLGE